MDFSATNEIKISDPSQSLVPTEEAPLQRFEHLKVNFTLGWWFVTFVSPARQTDHYILI